jgi:hypothetical protein
MVRGRIIKIGLASVIFIMLLCKPLFLFADVSIKIVAANPSDSEQTVPIRYSLPGGLKKEDIINTDGMNLDYDVTQTVYYIYGDLKLGPKESKTLKVVVKDVWKIPEGQVRDLLNIIDEKVRSIDDPEKQPKAKLIGQSLRDRVEDIVKQQTEAADDIEKRMQLYSINTTKLSEIREEIFDLEREIKFGGADKGLSGKTETSITLTIEAENVLNKEVHIPLKYYLPKEIMPEYILDKSGFDLKFNVEKAQFYLVKDEVFQPGEAKRFSITLKNVWNINQDILDVYLKEATDLNKELSTTEFAEIGKALFNEIQKNADEIIESQKKAESVAERIDTYRQNQKRLALIKDDVEKMKKLLNEAKKKEEGEGSDKIKDLLQKADFFKFQQLSDKLLKERLKKAGVWRIIVVIIGFTMALTVFFYGLWFLNLKKEEKRKLDKVTSKGTQEESGRETF